MQTERRVATNPQTKPADLDSIISSYYPHSPSPFIVITHPESWYSFYRPTDGVDLGTAGMVQKPVSKTAYRNGCRDKRTDCSLTTQQVSCHSTTATCTASSVNNLTNVVAQQRTARIQTRDRWIASQMFYQTTVKSKWRDVLRYCNGGNILS